MRLASRLSGVLLAVLTGPLAAQVQGHVDLGMGGAPLAGSGVASLWAVAPAFRWEPARFRIDGNGEYRDFGAAGHAWSGAASLSWFVPAGRTLLFEANGAGEGRQNPGLPGAVTWDAGARLHLRSTTTGAWLGLRGGRDRLGALERWEVGLWRNLGPLSLQLQGQRTSGGLLTGSGASPIADTLARPDTNSGQTRVRITTDFGMWVGWSLGRLQLRGGLGLRVGQAEPANSGTLADTPLSVATARYNWWTAEGTYWLSDRVGFTGTIGTQPPNPSLFVSGGQFMRLSIRVALDRRGERAALEAPAAPEGLKVRRSGIEVEFALPVPLASRVELMGDFTDWQPVALERGADGKWRTRLPVSPGVHYLDVRYDGSEWRAPPGARVVRDEFGKESGVILIE